MSLDIVERQEDPKGSIFLGKEPKFETIDVPACAETMRASDGARQTGHNMAAIAARYAALAEVWYTKADELEDRARIIGARRLGAGVLGVVEEG